MTDYHATQRTGSPCAPFNCAAASGAMGLYATTDGKVQLSADAFRARADVSCVPGVHSNSGGLFISDVVRVFDIYGELIDYGKTEMGYTRWSPPELRRRLHEEGEGGVLLGDYDALPIEYRASATFRGDHSVWVHDYRELDDTICWHDPLRLRPIRIPIGAAISYWQKPDSPIRGFAGWVTIPNEEVETVLRYKITSNVEGTVTVKGNGHMLVTLDGRRVPIPAGQVRECVAGVALLEPLDAVAGDRTNAWLVGRSVAPVNEPANLESALLLKSAATTQLVKVEVVK